MPDVIAIDGLRVSCVVGIYPHERATPQPVEVDLALRLDTTAAAARERMRATIDYAVVAAQVEFLLTSARFHMLETAAHAIAKTLLAPPARGERRARVASAQVRLTKPGALGGNGVPSLTIEREAKRVRLGHEDKPFGTVDVIHETRHAGIYRLNIAPGGSIPLHIHQRMNESEMVLSHGLLCQGVPAPFGSIRRWPHGAPHVYDNPTRRWQTILCVDAPPFLPDDEVVVEGEPAEVPWEVPVLLQGEGAG